MEESKTVLECVTFFRINNYVQFGFKRSNGSILNNNFAAMQIQTQGKEVIMETKSRIIMIQITQSKNNSIHPASL